MKITDMTEDAVLEALQAQDWGVFAPERDLPPLRAALVELERLHGVTKAHRIATERVRERGVLLRHPDVHRVGLTSQALSPSGRYLAVGSWISDDYDRGGTLQIWEVTTGRCVNVLDGIDGGIGWPGYGDMIQWSADETRIAMVFMTNNVGVWDPFGEDNEPIGRESLCADGRPPPFAFAPDGAQAYMIDDDNDIDYHGTIVSLEDGDLRCLPVEAEAADEDLDEADEAEDDYFILSRVVWSRDGQRLYGHLSDGRVCSIDVTSGTVSWVVAAEPNHDHPPAEWSRDERLVAFHRDGSLVIADAADGQPVAELPGCGDESYLSWGARLAVVVAGERVGIVDRAGEHHYDLDIALRDPSYDFDTPAWAWAPGDDERAVCLTAQGRIEIWSLGAERGERLRSFDAPEGANGVHWGAEGVIVALGETTLRFLRADSGEVIGDFTLLRQPPGPRPLEIDGKDLGDDVDSEPNPTFALDTDTWAVAFERGVAIAPSGREDDLAATLAWVVDRRFAWPVHWGELEIVADAPAAAERVPAPLPDCLEPFRGRTMPTPQPQEWPPPNTATVDDLFRAFQEAVLEYFEECGVDALNRWSGEALHGAALIRARRGEPAGALELVELCPGHRRRQVAAEVAMLLACAGLRDDARSLLSRYEVVDETMLGEPAGLAGAVGGACAALGEEERADRWFGRALQTVRKNRHSWEHRLPVVWVLMECSREEQARALLAEGTGVPGSDLSHPFLAYLLRTGRAGLAEELLGAEESWFEGWSANRILAEYGQPRMLVEWGERYNCWVDDDRPIAERNAAEGRPAEPGDDEIEALARAHAEILRTPPGRRQTPIYELVLNAAECRHLGAVLDLLPQLNMPSYGGISSRERPWVAYSALRIVTTGVDIDPW